MTSDSGLTLIELAVVVAIVGILATLAGPSFKMFIAKARQTEAKINLAHIETLQSSYMFEFDSYFSGLDIGGASGKCATANKKNELGFRPKGCDRLRYNYSGSATTIANASGSGDYRIFPGCMQADGWTNTIATGKIVNSTKVVSNCN